MRCLVTYDVNQPHHAAVKAQCIRAGFCDYVEMPDGSYRQLPNTTLIVEAVDAEDAVNKFKAQVGLVTPNGLASSSLSALSGLMSPSHVRIEKVVGVQYTEEPYAESDNSDYTRMAAALRQQGQ